MQNREGHLYIYKLYTSLYLWYQNFLAVFLVIFLNLTAIGLRTFDMSDFGRTLKSWRKFSILYTKKRALTSTKRIWSQKFDISYLCREKIIQSYRKITYIYPKIHDFKGIMALKTGRKEYPYHVSGLQDSPKCIDTENRIKSRFLQV